MIKRDYQRSFIIERKKERKKTLDLNLEHLVFVFSLNRVFEKLPLLPPFPFFKKFKNYLSSSYIARTKQSSINNNFLLYLRKRRLKIVKTHRITI